MRRFTLDLSTDGNADIVNLSPQIAARGDQLTGEGLLHLFVVGSTAALITIEFEAGLVKHDLPALLQRLAAEDAHYHHEATWNDDNGHSHLRASLLGPSLTIPFTNGRLLTGEYQQVALVELDTRPRRRKIICTVIV